MPRCSFRKILFILLCLYCFTAIYTTFILLEWQKYIFRKVPNDFRNNLFDSHYLKPSSLNTTSHLAEVPELRRKHIVEIWSKAAIGLYFWRHIFGGDLDDRDYGVWHYGEKSIRNIIFKFRTGPGVTQSLIEEFQTEHAVLILNGRDDEKIEFARSWLQIVTKLSHVRKVALILLGNEQCHNDWVKVYLRRYGGIIDFAAIVYDIPEANDDIYLQWPLGVATYRKFVVPNATQLRVDRKRQFLCNFMGTVYPDSSREILVKIISENNLTSQCFISARKTWLPDETSSSRLEYMRVLGDSDLTLCPVGINSESYRIYEAISYGSVPVIEDVMTPGVCGRNFSMAGHEGVPVAFRLLKLYRAPVIFVSQWTELPDLIEWEKRHELEFVVKRRKALLEWYEKFRSSIAETFVRTVERKFFS